MLGCAELLNATTQKAGPLQLLSSRSHCHCAVTKATCHTSPHSDRLTRLMVTSSSPHPTRATTQQRVARRNFSCSPSLRHCCALAKHNDCTSAHCSTRAPPRLPHLTNDPFSCTSRRLLVIPHPLIGSLHRRQLTTTSSPCPLPLPRRDYLTLVQCSAPSPVTQSSSSTSGSPACITAALSLSRTCFLPSQRSRLSVLCIARSSVHSSGLPCPPELCAPP